MPITEYRHATQHDTAISFILSTCCHIPGERNLPAVCEDTPTIVPDSCDAQSSIETWYYPAIFCLGMFLIGIAGSPLYVLGVAYLDESVKRKIAPIYIGIFGSSGTVGKFVYRPAGVVEKRSQRRPSLLKLRLCRGHTGQNDHVYVGASQHWSRAMFKYIRLTQTIKDVALH